MKLSALVGIDVRVFLGEKKPFSPDLWKECRYTMYVRFEECSSTGKHAMDSKRRRRRRKKGTRNVRHSEVDSRHGK